MVSKLFDGIHYGFRPHSYWLPDDDALRGLLRNVKGTNRRQMIRDYWESGAIDRLEQEIKAHALDETTRERLGSLHPSFMGGEYLPDYLKGEVEIARIELQSTTSDVMSIRARRGPKSGRIRYAIVDEYEQDFVFSPKSSSRPLTFGNLVDMIDGAAPCEDFDWGGACPGPPRGPGCPRSRRRPPRAPLHLPPGR
jgi:hypothetical protein